MLVEDFSGTGTSVKKGDNCSQDELPARMTKVFVDFDTMLFQDEFEGLMEHAVALKDETIAGRDDVSDDGGQASRCPGGRPLGGHLVPRSKNVASPAVDDRRQGPYVNTASGGTSAATFRFLGRLGALAAALGRSLVSAEAQNRKPIMDEGEPGADYARVMTVQQDAQGQRFRNFQYGVSRCESPDFKTCQCQVLEHVCGCCRRGTPLSLYAG